MAPHSSTLAWKIPWTEEPGRLQRMGSLESDTTEQLHFHFSLSCIGEGNGNHSHVFQELLSVDLFVLGNIEFVLTMLGLCCSLEVARTSGLQSPISC